MEKINDFHVLLKELRLRKGLNQSEAAAMFGYTKAYWNHLEKGKFPSEELYKVICQKFELTEKESERLKILIDLGKSPESIRVKFIEMEEKLSK